MSAPKSPSWLLEKAGVETVAVAANAAKTVAAKNDLILKESDLRRSVLSRLTDHLCEHI